MQTSNEEERQYLEEYKKVLSNLAAIASEHPEMIGMLRAALKQNASLTITDSPGVVAEMQQLTDKVDAFLAACQSGEVRPEDFILEEDKPEKPPDL
ncbi:MAG: hypothetical protein FJY97_08875 [candidate division Zixibacteria bacterium]|nr:hypothetical protein [candidate division Zixibacteria bacterium]